MFESVTFCRRERKSLRKLEKLLKPDRPVIGHCHTGVDTVYTHFVARNCSGRMCKGCFYSGRSSILNKNCRLLDRALKLGLITTFQAVTTYYVVDTLIKFHVASIIEM